MAEEIKESVAYLVALKQSGGAAAAPAEAKEPKVSIASGDPEKTGAEKRRSPRYKCEGSVKICEEGCEVATWASFTDVSLHGCYVEAQATYPVGTVLAMKLEANDVRFETKGVVRVTYPYLGMGIAFSDISDENISNLKQLLAVVSRPCLIMGPGIASSLPATDKLNAVPAITKPGAAVSALLEFFESHQILMRDDFLRILRKSQDVIPAH